MQDSKSYTWNSFVLRDISVINLITQRKQEFREMISIYKRKILNYKWKRRFPDINWIRPLKQNWLVGGQLMMLCVSNISEHWMRDRLLHNTVMTWHDGSCHWTMHVVMRRSPLTQHNPSHHSMPITQIRLSSSNHFIAVSFSWSLLVILYEDFLEEIMCYKCTHWMIIIAESIVSCFV